MNLVFLNPLKRLLARRPGCEGKRRLTVNEPKRTGCNTGHPERVEHRKRHTAFLELP